MKTIARHRQRVCRECRTQCTPYLAGQLDHADPAAACPLGVWLAITSPPRADVDPAIIAAPYIRPTNGKTLIERIGPALWATLHLRSSLPTLNLSAEAAWLAGPFSASLPCGECRRHFREFCAANPPTLESREAYFSWTVALHNAVNRLLLKPEWMVSPQRIAPEL